MAFGMTVIYVKPAFFTLAAYCALAVLNTQYGSIIGLRNVELRFQTIAAFFSS